MILDTNGLSAFADGDPAIEMIIRDADELFLPAIVLGEYLYGVRQSREHRKYERWLIEFRPAFRLLPVDAATAEPYSSLRSEL